MGFDTLLGNSQLKQNLAESIARGRISHFYLICGPEGSGKHTLARLLAAAILCGEENRPCLRCRNCRRVMEGNHPDFITVDDPEKKTVTVELVRQARADIYVLPNESDHKIYLFPRAQDMGIPGQNALLKVLEEPPAYGVFILLTDNPDKLLPTVRSRCTMLKLQPLPEQVLVGQLRTDYPRLEEATLAAAAERSGGFLGQARALLSEDGEDIPQVGAFAAAFGKKDALALVQLLGPMEKWKRDALLDMLARWMRLMEEALLSRSGVGAVSSYARQLAGQCTAQQLHDGLVQLRKASDYAQSNVSPGAVCGWLAWALR